VDETYAKVAGARTYLYRAVDSAGDTIDFMCPRSAMWRQPNCSSAWRYPRLVAGAAWRSGGPSWRSPSCRPPICHRSR